MPLRISRRSQGKFAEYASAFSTLNQIRQTFEAEGFDANQDYAVVGRAVAYSNLAEVKQRLGALPEAAR